MGDAPTQRAGSGAQAERSQPDRQVRFVLPVLALLSALFFAGALAYAVGGGFLGGGKDEDAGLSDRSQRGLPRDWANMIPLQPVDPDLKPDSGTASASDDSDPWWPGGSGATSGPAADPGSSPALALSPRPAPSIRVVSRRLPALVDVTSLATSRPELPDVGGSVPKIDALPGDIDIPPILPDGLNIPPILPGGVPIPRIGPLPGVPRVPPIGPLPGGGGGLPLPGMGGGLPFPDGVPSPAGVALRDGLQGPAGATGVAPLLPLALVASGSRAIASAPAEDTPERRTGDRAGSERRKQQGEIAEAASKRRAARSRRARKASVAEEPAVPARDAEPDRTRRHPAVSEGQAPAKQKARGSAEDCDPGRTVKRSGSPPAGCDDSPADTGESSDRQPQREAPRKPSRDRAARAEGEDGP